MTPYEAVSRIGKQLHGVPATSRDIQVLRHFFSETLMPDWFLALLMDFGLAGTYFSLDLDEDQSGVGADVLWLTPEQMISEARDSEPGLSIMSSGFIPVGACAQGSGDPYFLDLRDMSANPPFVRVPHDYAGGSSYPLHKIEVVLSSLSEFFVRSKL